MTQSRHAPVPASSQMQTSKGLAEDQIIAKIRERIRQNKLDIKQGFEAFDADKNGRINRREFMDAFKMLNFGLSPAEVDKMFKYFDSDNSGYIDYHKFCFRLQDSPEWVEAILRQVRQRIRENNLNIREAFRAFDKDNSGRINLAEFKDCFQQMQLSVNPTQVSDLFQYFDIHRKGQIDFKDFSDAIEGRLDSSRGH